ncbi:30S ribosomal protein S7 [Candidatus Microgenomates bacterium]|nr:30S ribosomal protein S7 [Candidatus Microgenomates bacterium]
MARAKRIRKKIVQPDPLYSNRLVTKFINRLMKDGKKSVASGVFYKTLSLVKEKSGQDGIELMTQAVQTVGPRMEVRARRVGGASYQVPMEVRGDRREALAIRWIIQAANKRNPKEFAKQNRKMPIMSHKLASELIDSAKGLGEAIKKRDSTHRMAEANRAFAHFRW